jgi:NAD-dependent SIR2 family protein deacetylase
MSTGDQGCLNTEDLRNNDLVFDELVQLVGSGEAIVLVGAGSSVSAGLPSWDGLLEHLASVARGYDPAFPKLAAEVSRLVYADRLRQCLDTHEGPEFIENQLAQLFRAPARRTAFHDALVRLPFRAFLTTNYDSVIEQAFDASAGRTLSAVPVSGGDASQVARAIRGIAARDVVSAILHVHGHVNQPRTIVLSSQDYIRAYGFDCDQASQPPANRRHTRLWTLMSALLATRRLVFLGFSLEDHYFRLLLSRITDMGWEWESNTHIALLPIGAEKAEAQRAYAARLRRELGVGTILYQVVAGQHSQRDLLVDRLLRAIPNPSALVDRQLHVPPVLTGKGQPLIPDWVQRQNKAFEERTKRHAD